MNETLHAGIVLDPVEAPVEEPVRAPAIYPHTVHLSTVDTHHCIVNSFPDSSDSKMYPRVVVITENSHLPIRRGNYELREGTYVRVDE